MLRVSGFCVRVYILYDTGTAVCHTRFVFLRRRGYFCIIWSEKGSRWGEALRGRPDPFVSLDNFLALWRRFPPAKDPSKHILIVEAREPKTFTVFTEGETLTIHPLFCT